jgi:hypothetical protein
VKFEDGTRLTLPPTEYDGKRERLSFQHGKVTEYKSNPEDAGALRDILKQAREKREGDARPAAFKLRVQNPKPSIKQQIAAGQKQPAAQRAAAPARAAKKNLNTGLGD